MKTLPQDCECDVEHGPLYVCSGYSPEKKRELEISRAQFEKNTRDPAWRQRQVDSGTPPEVVAMFCTLFGASTDGPGLQ